MKPGVIDRLHQPETQQQAISEIAEWVKETCLLFGSTQYTAYTVAGLFAGQLEQEYRMKKSEDSEQYAR